MKKKIEETKKWITKNNKKSIGILVSVLLLIVIVPGTIVGINASNASNDKEKTTSENTKKTNSKSNEKDNNSEKSGATNVASKESTTEKTANKTNTSDSSLSNGESSDSSGNSNGSNSGENSSGGTTSSGSNNGTTGSGSNSNSIGSNSGGNSGENSSGGTTTPPAPKPDPVKPTIPAKPSIPSDKKCGYITTSEAIKKADAYTGLNYGDNNSDSLASEYGYECISDYSWNGSSWNAVWKKDMPAWVIYYSSGVTVMVMGNGTVYPY